MMNSTTQVPKPRKERKPFVPLPMFYDTTDKYDIEIGVDEAGRGPLFGRLYVAGVVLPKDGSMDTSQIRDSKKISKKKLPELYEFVKTHALAYHIAYIEASEIDEINIREAVVKAMHLCCSEILKQLNPKIEKCILLIDGNDFPPYYHNNTRIDYKTFLQGDDAYASIAAASILAKVARDQYILELCETYPSLKETYFMHEHMGYGTKKHLEAIRTHGITPYHRKTYGICKQSKLYVTNEF